MQNTEDTVDFFREIKTVPISQGLFGTMADASQPTNRNVNTIAKLYAFVNNRGDGFSCRLPFVLVEVFEQVIHRLL